MSIVEKSIKPTIKGSFVRELLEGYEAQGRDCQQILSKVGITCLFESDHARISPSDYAKVIQLVQEELEDESLGFSPKPVPLGSKSLLCDTVTNLPNIKTALDFYNNYYALFNNGMEPFKLLEKGDVFRIQLRCVTELQKVSRYYAQSMFLILYKFLCWLASAQVNIQKIAFALPVVEDTPELGYVFDFVDVLANADVDYMEIHKDTLKLPVLQSPESADEFAKNSMVYTLLWPDAESLESKIRSIIGHDISNGFPDFNNVAAALGVSPQTLSRRLNEREITYQLIKDNIRRDAAIALLSNSRLTIKEIAFQVGFKETSSFSKAFKQWVGVPPSEYRAG